MEYDVSEEYASRFYRSIFKKHSSLIYPIGENKQKKIQKMSPKTAKCIFLYC